MSPRTAKPGAAYFKAVRKALKATGSPSQEDKDAALAALDMLEEDFAVAARDRKLMADEARKQKRQADKT